MIALIATLFMTASKVQSAPPASPKLIVVYSIVRGFKNVGPGPNAGPCLLDSRFRHNEEIVWRIKVLDPASGAFLGDKAVRSVEIKLASGETLPARYGPHPWKDPKPTDSFWSAAWTVPAGYPTGTLRYSISAIAKDGRTSTTVDFDINASKLVVLEGTVPKR
jgi:hypothetical protein